MSSVMPGPGSYAFWGIEATREGGIQGEHLPFNPCEELPVSEFGYVMKQIHVANELNHAIEFTEKIEIPEMDFSFLYRDPLLLLVATQHNTVTAVWTGTGDAITGDFTETDHKNTIWMQVHINNDDGSNHVNLTFKGGEITEYTWVLERGKAIREKVKIQFSAVAAATQAPDMDSGLDDGSFDTTGVDGGWSNWDGAYSSNQAAMSQQCTVTHGGSALNVHWKKINFPLMLPRVHEQTGDSLDPEVFYDDQRPQPIIEVEGLLKGNQDVAEILNDYESKTPATFKIQYGTTKYVQITNVYVKNTSGFKFPKGEGTLRMPAGAGWAWSFSWTANETTDPSDYITHDSP